MASAHILGIKHHRGRNNEKKYLYRCIVQDLCWGQHKPSRLKGRQAQSIKRIAADPTGTEHVSEQEGGELSGPWNLWS